MLPAKRGDMGEEECAGECVAGLALAESGPGAASLFGVVEPVEHEQGTLDAPERGTAASRRAAGSLRRDVELRPDPERYMALKNTGYGRITPRIGERMTWAGPRDYLEDDPNVRVLRDRCGGGPIVAVGEPGRAPRIR